ncbi:glutamate--cysteine ligase [Dactylosporangium sp. CA-092794]|uniref:glutamate--cysteine ligase n=1 Tax=Dactylosporangium sp. CA-092794 TaxID=3239929 RepID=UPI003D93CF70
MGKDVESHVFSREDRMRYRDKVRRCLDAFARMLAGSSFEAAQGMSGMEIELNLVDARYDPALRNQRVLDALSDPAFVTELGQFNIEINVPPRSLAGDGFAGFESQVRDSLNAAEKHAAQVDTRLAMIGILPTLRRDQLTPDVLSANPRYSLLNEQIFAARGEDLLISIDGVERLHVRCDSIAPEAACTSVQFHLQVTPQRFAAYWNAAQAIAAAQVAVGANAAFLFGRELWRETRIPLFEQATDTRAEELKSQGVRPRVWFGERWITSIFDLFEENVRYFPALLPIVEDEDPIATLAGGGTPELAELKLHNGTVYRWNRPIYDVVDGRPHLRVENRVLPAGPTVVDSMANAAFYFGLVHRLARQDRPVWTQMSFGAAEENFHAAARRGIEADLFWPGLGSVPVTELVLRRLLPLAYEGLDAWGVDPQHRDRLLGIIEQRCLAQRNGATWQVEAVHAIEGAGPVDRDDTMRKLLAEYLPRMHSNVPVHEW